MKKEMLLSGALLLSSGVFAEQKEMSLEDIKKDANTIVYSLTITKDTKCDEDAWSKAIDITAELSLRGDEASDKDMVDATLKAMQEVYALTDAEGIHANLNVGVGDSEDFTKGCDGICGGDDPKDR